MEWGDFPSFHSSVPPRLDLGPLQVALSALQLGLIPLQLALRPLQLDLRHLQLGPNGATSRFRPLWLVIIPL